MKNLTLLILTFFILTSPFLNAQYVRLTYKTFAISYPENKIVIDTVYNFIQKEKSISLGKTYFESVVNHTDTIKRYFTIADKKKKAYKELIKVNFTNKTDSLIISINTTTSWKKREYLINKYNSLKDVDGKKHPLDIKYFNESKIIGSYNCYKAVINSIDGELEVWYTKSIDYNWIFNNYYNQIPGTVILVKNSNKIFFEFLREEFINEPKLQIIGWE